MTAVGPGMIAVRMSLVWFVAITLQMAVAARLELFDVQGDLMLLIAVTAGLAAGPDRGATLGFFTGLVFDLMLQSPFGLSALTYALVGYLAGSLQDSFLRASWWIPVVTAIIGSAIGVILYGVFGTVVGEDLLKPRLLVVAGVVALLNAIPAAPMLKVVQWATGTSDTVRARAVMR